MPRRKVYFDESPESGPEPMSLKPRRARRAARIQRSVRSVAAVIDEPKIELTMDPDPIAPPSPEEGPMSGPKSSYVVFSNSTCKSCGGKAGKTNSALSLLVVTVLALSLITLSATVLIDSQSLQIEAFNAKTVAVGFHQ